MLAQEDRINKIIGDITAHRARYPHRVSIYQPSTPWDSEHWVNERDLLADQLCQWLENNGLLFNYDYSFWHKSFDCLIVFGFKDPKHAVFFKLAKGGR